MAELSPLAGSEAVASPRAAAVLVVFRPGIDVAAEEETATLPSGRRRISIL